MNINKLSYGIVVGLILPVVTIVLFYNFAYHGYKNFRDFFEALVFLKSAAMMLAVSSLSNLAAFLFCAYANKLNLARGIFLSTVVYALIVLVFKFGIQ